MSFLILFWTGARGQKIIDCLQPEKGTIQYAEDLSLPATASGYTLILPNDEKPCGLVVFFHMQAPDAPLDNITQLALNKNMGVLYLTTNNRLEFFFEKEKMRSVANNLLEVVKQFPQTRSNLLFAGMSLEGTRALKLTRFLKENSGYQIHPKAIVICDAPLDMIRFYAAAKRAADLNFQESAANEGKWVSSYLEANLGKPSNNQSAYLAYSPFCHNHPDNTYLEYLDKVHLWAYTEPDVQWWMETRRKSYYDMNAIDFAALVNELNIRGNENARLILTQDKGIRPDGSRHPHSWSIVDEAAVINWFEAMIP